VLENKRLRKGFRGENQFLKMSKKIFNEFIVNYTPEAI
jgi:hypothetical protein